MKLKGIYLHGKSAFCIRKPVNTTPNIGYDTILKNESLTKEKASAILYDTMSIFDQFSKVTKDFGNKAQEMTKDIKGKLEEQQAISRLNAQVNEAKNQMKNTYMAIGERYYELHKDDVENDMANQFQIIADAMEKIAKC